MNSALPLCMPVDEAFRVASIEAFVFRAPAVPEVRTSFGIMRERPALLVRLVDGDGLVGWGEAWCNFPAVGAEHRARLLASVLAPMCRGPLWESPAALFDALTARTHILGIQTGEPGPLAQGIAAIDMAAWDIVGQRAGVPLWRLFGGAPKVAVYASGINHVAPLDVVRDKAGAGYRAFKLKVGFDDGLDEKNVETLREYLGAAGVLMADANQAWDLARARRMLRRLEPHGLLWVEEPVAADIAWSDWHALASGTSLRLAAGENLRGEAAFREAVHDGGIRVVQPDPGKWGGFSGCLPAARAAQAAGAWFCPHWLGAGIGLRAAMHLKAVVGGDGYVEVDANPNPLRGLLGAPDFVVDDGWVTLPRTPGLGVQPLLEAARPYLVLETSG